MFLTVEIVEVMYCLVWCVSGNGLGFGGWLHGSVDQPTPGGDLPQETSRTPPGDECLAGLRRPWVTSPLRPAGEMCVYRIICSIFSTLLSIVMLWSQFCCQWVCFLLITGYWVLSSIALNCPCSREISKTELLLENYAFYSHFTSLQNSAYHWNR